MFQQNELSDYVFKLKMQKSQEHTPAPTGTRAVYGFSLFLLFKTLFFLYVFWAFVPTHILEGLFGLTYLPDKYFALFVPMLILVGTAFFAFFIYPGLSLAMTADVDDLSTIKDKFTIYRCQYRIENSSKACDDKIEETEKWNLNKFCSHHSEIIKEQRSEDVPFTYDGDNLSERFCDCNNLEKCLLSNKKLSGNNYLNILTDRKSVPTVSDLSLSDVCKNLYGNS